MLVDGTVAVAGTTPTVSSVTPAYGPESGGTTVTIIGTNLSGLTAVNFGTTAAASFTAVSSTSITAVSPAGRGVVDVIVSTLAGTSTAGNKDRFDYGPEVTSVSPAFGPSSGGTAVTIYGTNLSEATAVHFGNTLAAYTITSDGIISATSPAGSGSVDVEVSSAQDSSAIVSADRFSYGPTVTGITPSAGPPSGGTSVTIVGSNFTGATSVSFGTATVPSSSFAMATDTGITLPSPGGTGVVDVVVTTPGGTSPTSGADKFSYAPVATSVNPPFGPSTGGTTVTITGSNLTGVYAVNFGSSPASSVMVISDTEVTAVTPPGKVPKVAVTVISPGGTSSPSPGATFLYGPVIAKVTPAVGVGSGGTKVVILGQDFKAVSAVMFGQVPANSFKARSATKIVAIAPAGVGLVDVTVQSPAGTSPLVGTDRFDYAPTVTKISPVQGPVAGGTKVRISGTNFQGVTAVNFGSTPAAKLTVVSKKQIVAVSPPGTGTVDITIVSLGGTSPISSSDVFTY